MPASSSSDPGFCIIDRRTPAAPPEFADITASPPAMRLEVRGGNVVERNVPLLRGPATETDPTGTGLVVDAHAGVVTEVLPDGVAERWDEIFKGDEIVSISSQPFKHGTPLLEQLVAGKPTYLIKVRRVVKSKESFASRLKTFFVDTAHREWTSEEQVAAAWADAGDWQRAGASRE